MSWARNDGPPAGRLAACLDGSLAATGPDNVEGEAPLVGGLDGFDDPETTGLETVETTNKDHGRIETRQTTVSQEVAWLQSDRRHPDEPRFPALRTLVRTITRTERRSKVTEETRYFISSAVLSPERAAEAIRGHWGIESMHWVMDVLFKEDQSRLRKGHGAQNMALVRRFAFNIVRAGRGKRSIKTTRKMAGWNPSEITLPAYSLGSGKPNML